MIPFIDPSQLSPLLTAQQVTCAYPISDFYGDCPRYLYYALLVACILIRWHPWLSDAFLGVAATYAGVAAIESFVLLVGWTDLPDLQHVSIPYIDSANVPGNQTYYWLDNLVTDSDSVFVQPGVLENDVDAILAIVVTSYLFMLPVHCWSTHVRGHRARHILMAMWNVLMLCATICSLILWTRLGSVPPQYRFCYPSYPDIDTVTNDGWLSTLWREDWNSTIWHTFHNPEAYNILTENCMYPCFNTSHVLRRPQSIVASVITNISPRTSNDLSDAEVARLNYLVDFMYTAIAISAFAAIVVLVMTSTGMQKITIIPLSQPMLVWTDRKRIRERIVSDVKNILRPYRRRNTERTLASTEKEAEANLRALASSSTSSSLCPSTQSVHRHRSFIRLFADTVASIMFLIVCIIIPATWIAFIVWIEWWLHRDLASGETPRQVGQWAPAVSVGFLLFSAYVLRLKYWLASKEEVEHEIGMLKLKVEALEQLKETKKG